MAVLGAEQQEAVVVAVPQRRARDGRAQRRAQRQREAGRQRDEVPELDGGQRDRDEAACGAWRDAGRESAQRARQAKGQAEGDEKDGESSSLAARPRGKRGSVKYGGQAGGRRAGGHGAADTPWLGMKCTATSSDWSAWRSVASTPARPSTFTQPSAVPTASSEDDGSKSMHVAALGMPCVRPPPGTASA